MKGIARSPRIERRPSPVRNQPGLNCQDSARFIPCCPSPRPSPPRGEGAGARRQHGVTLVERSGTFSAENPHPMRPAAWPAVAIAGRAATAGPNRGRIALPARGRGAMTWGLRHGCVVGGWPHGGRGHAAGLAAACRAHVDRDGAGPRVNADRAYPRAVAGVAYCGCLGSRGGAALERRLTVRAEGRQGMFSAREPPGGDASWLVLVRAPRIPLTAAEALCAFLRRKSRGAQRLRSPRLPKASSGNAAGMEVLGIGSRQ